MKGPRDSHWRETRLDYEIPRYRGRKSRGNAGSRLGITIIKRDTAVMGNAYAHQGLQRLPDLAGRL